MKIQQSLLLTLVLGSLHAAVWAQTGFALPLDPAGDLEGSRMHWEDFDGDGLVDLYVTPAGRTDVLLQNQGDGTFVDATTFAGLQDRTSRLVRIGDFQSDGRLDLLLVSMTGEVSLMQGAAGGVFEDVTALVGVGSTSGVRRAGWLDWDGDGAVDLWLETVDGSPVLLRNLGGSFEPGVLGLPGPAPALLAPTVPTVPTGAAAEEEEAPTGSSGVNRSARTPERGRARIDARPQPPAPPSELNAAAPRAQTIQDAAVPTSYLRASSAPILGRLYPLSVDLCVTGSGKVGVGTTRPGVQLDVIGDARATRFHSIVPQGTAPFTVDSTTTVRNLNADLLDGQSAANFRLVSSLIGPADLASNSVDSSKVLDDSLTAGDIATDAIGSLELGPGAVGTLHLSSGAILNAHVSAGASIAGTKIVPDFGGQDVQTTGTGDFGSAVIEDWKVRSVGPYGPTLGYLSVQGTDDFGGLSTLDIDGLEVGMIGVSTGSTSSDNYGVLGHSNGVGVRGEHSLDPTGNFAELGASGVGIFATGTTYAGDFAGDVRTDGEVHRPSTGSANLVPIAYGYVETDGTVGANSGNFTVAWNGSEWVITITGETYWYSSYVTVITPQWPDTGVNTDSWQGNLLVRTTDLSAGIPEQRGFQFVTFKP